VMDARLAAPPRFWSGVSWGDFNNDRRLDLYACAYVEYVGNEVDREVVSDQLGTAVPFTLNPASYPGGRNALYRQNADGTFTDVAADLGVENPAGRSLGALWHDFDQDGWLELYVANDVSDNVLYHNRQGRFVDISHPAWVADYRSAMGLAVGDFDRDGDDDLFVSHWVAQENGMYENLWANLGPTSTNRLRFMDIADQKGLGQISLPRVGWGSAFADLDHDGWLDLVCVNGNTIEETGPPPRKLKPQVPFLFWNRQGQSFHDLAPLHPGLATAHVSRGLALADYDNDGDLDLAIADLYEGVRLFRNERVTGNWLKLHLRARNAKGQAMAQAEGSTAIAWVGGVGLRRSLTGVSYLSQDSRVLHWGLGAVPRVDRLEVRWHAGGTQQVENIEANTTWIWTEGDPAPKPFQPDARLTSVSAKPGIGSRAMPELTDRERLLRFWDLHRTAMDVLKREKAPARAIPIYREALALNPEHEDARYYLALCLAAGGAAGDALEALAVLRTINPQSHRAWQQWGIIRAQSAETDAELAAAEASLERAQGINTAETGALFLLGEVSLLRGQFALAETRLAAVCQSNPKAAGAFFLRGYLAWKRGEVGASTELLSRAREALGPDWQPQGATSEGDVRVKQHEEVNLLARFWQTWTGEANPGTAFSDLESFLSRHPKWPKVRSSGFSPPSTMSSPG
jgi:tetratricopeptide (TPR) repeat protein